jgi:hypothetical protein
VTRAELDYLASLVRMDIRKRERALTRFAPKPGQSGVEAAEVRLKFEQHLAFLRGTLANLNHERRLRLD